MLEGFNFRASVPQDNAAEEIMGHIFSLWVKSQILDKQLCEIIAHLRNVPVDEVHKQYDEEELNLRVDYAALIMKKYPNP